VDSGRSDQGVTTAAGRDRRRVIVSPQVWHGTVPMYRSSANAAIPSKALGAALPNR